MTRPEDSHPVVYVLRIREVKEVLTELDLRGFTFDLTIYHEQAGHDSVVGILLFFSRWRLGVAAKCHIFAVSDAGEFTSMDEVQTVYLLARHFRQVPEVRHREALVVGVLECCSWFLVVSMKEESKWSDESSKT